MHFKLFASASTLALTAMTTSIDAFPEQTLTETYLSEALAQTNAMADSVSHSHSHSHAEKEREALFPIMTPEEKKEKAAAQQSANDEAKHGYDMDRFSGPGPMENTLDWFKNMWKIGKPIYDAYRPKLCEECTMDPWIVMRRLKQIMDCKINCQPPYLFKPSKTGPPRPEQAIGQTFPNNKPLPYDPDNINIKKKMLQEDKEAAKASGIASNAEMAASLKAADEMYAKNKAIQTEKAAAAAKAKVQEAAQGAMKGTLSFFTKKQDDTPKAPAPVGGPATPVPATPALQASGVSVKAQTGVVYPVGTGYNQPTADLGSYY